MALQLHDFPEIRGGRADLRPEDFSSLRNCREDLGSKANHVIAERRLLRTHAQVAAIGDSCWDILLGLYVKGELTISDLSKLAGLPLTTTLRWLVQLDEQDLVLRSEKPGDRRAALIGLSLKGAELVETLLRTMESEESSTTPSKRLKPDLSIEVC